MELSPKQVSDYFIQQLDGFQVFIKLTELQWEEEFTSYEQSLDIEEHESLSWTRYSYRHDLSAKITQEFPQYQRQSQLIMIVSLFEDYLNQLCLSIQKTNELHVALTDIKGSGIERAKTYLKKVVGIQFSSASNAWNSILNAQSIRNIVAHNAGHLDEFRHTKHLNVVKDSNDLDAEEFARLHLIIKEGYLSSVVSAMKDFSLTLNDMLHNI